MNVLWGIVIAIAAILSFEDVSTGLKIPIGIGGFVAGFLFLAPASIVPARAVTKRSAKPRKSLPRRPARSCET